MVGGHTPTHSHSRNTREDKQEGTESVKIRRAEDCGPVDSLARSGANSLVIRRDQKDERHKDEIHREEK